VENENGQHLSCCHHCKGKGGKWLRKERHEALTLKVKVMFGKFHEWIKCQPCKGAGLIADPKPGEAA
jgi:DnaJ-class molecular chaperone